MHTHTCALTHTWMYTIRSYTGTHAARTRTHASACACLCSYAHSNRCTHTPKHTHARTHPRPHTRAQAHTHTHTHSLAQYPSFTHKCKEILNKAAGYTDFIVAKCRPARSWTSSFKVYTCNSPTAASGLPWLEAVRFSYSTPYYGMSIFQTTDKWSRMNHPLHCSLAYTPTCKSFRTLCRYTKLSDTDTLFHNFFQVGSTLLMVSHKSGVCITCQTLWNLICMNIDQCKCCKSDCIHRWLHRNLVNSEKAEQK